MTKRSIDVTPDELFIEHILAQHSTARAFAVIAITDTGLNVGSRLLEFAGGSKAAPTAAERVTALRGMKAQLAAAHSQAQNGIDAVIATLESGQL